METDEKKRPYVRMATGNKKAEASSRQVKQK